ncbi:MAG: MBL fold metallo-hydrolase [Ruminococcaceae bacterium]|nr:MBL fold metallo-hydrolase [Oscillospiraceae bacterium]
MNTEIRSIGAPSSAPYSLRMLYSGSTGNAALLTCEGTALLIDAGRSARALTAALQEAGTEPDTVSAILLTHEHRDHTSALAVFLKHHPVPVHTTAASAERLIAELGEGMGEHLVIHPPVFALTVGPFTVTSFPTLHDSAGSVGYRISCKGRSIGYATDLGGITPAVEEGLFGCEAVVLECNHDEEMLKTGPYPYFLKKRIASRHGHLSNTDCAAFCTRLATCGMKRLLLAHLSETNNLPELALSEVRAALAGCDVRVRAADPVHATEL